MLASLLVAGRVLASSSLNVLQKQLMHNRLHPLVIIAAGFVILSLLLAPVLFYVSLAGLSAVFWTNMLIGTLLDGPGNIFLVTSVGKSDLSLVGPLNAYKPIVGLLLALMLLGEVPSWEGVAGIAVIFAGSLFLAPSGERAGWRAFVALAYDRGVQFRMLSIVMTSGAAVFIKAALLEASPLQTFMTWTFLIAPLSVVAVVLLMGPRLGEAVRLVHANRGRLFVLAFLYLPMQLLTLKILELMYVGYALALFQLSAIVNVFFGYTLFKEQHILQRAIGSGIMILGAALLILAQIRT